MKLFSGLLAAFSPEPRPPFRHIQNPEVRAQFGEEALRGLELAAALRLDRGYYALMNFYAVIGKNAPANLKLSEIETAQLGHFIYTGIDAHKYSELYLNANLVGGRGITDTLLSMVVKRPSLEIPQDLRTLPAIVGKVLAVHEHFAEYPEESRIGSDDLNIQREQITGFLHELTTLVSNNDFKACAAELFALQVAKAKTAQIS